MPEPKHAAHRRKELVALLKRVANGDRKALSAVYDRTSSKLFGVCLRITRDREAAEDVLQDVYLKIWNRAGRFDAERASPITWLCAIARNTAIDWVRKYGAAPLSRPDGASPDESNHDFDGAMEVMAEAEGRTQILDCLESLTKNHRIAIRLAYFDGLSHSELANALKVPLGTSKSWIRRGLLQLRGCLQGE